MSRPEPKTKKKSGTAATIVVTGIVALAWTVPTIGVLVTSFRDSGDIFSSGWWTVFPHEDWSKTGEFEADPALDLDQPITLEGRTAGFNQWRAGVEVKPDRLLKWIGNKRTRTVSVFEKGWVGFGAHLTLANYANVLTSGEIQYKDAQGMVISREGSNFGDAVLNSLAVSIPATKSASSTARRRNSNSGRWSSRAPTPYRTAATCLHIDAWSGQLQEKRISEGRGNRPPSWRHSRSMTPLENRPWSSSTRESMPPAQSAQIARHFVFIASLMEIETL